IGFARQKSPGSSRRDPGPTAKKTPPVCTRGGRPGGRGTGAGRRGGWALYHPRSTAASSAAGISTGRGPAPAPLGHRRCPSSAAATETPSLHVDAAASAALLAIEKARRGIYNIAEPNRYLSTNKARRELRFDPSFRLTAWVGLSIR